eukprot:scaffold1180_cov321-Prasinococcus_capsulatus_cf.AAC.4
MPVSKGEGLYISVRAPGYELDAILAQNALEQQLRAQLLARFGQPQDAPRQDLERQHTRAPHVAPRVIPTSRKRQHTWAQVGRRPHTQKQRTAVAMPSRLSPRLGRTIP